MNHHQARAEIERIRMAESEDLAAWLAAARGPDGMIPRNAHLSLEERARLSVREQIENPTLFHRERKNSRGPLVLAHGHPDGHLRWVRGLPMEGGPNHPRWQATLDASESLTDQEAAEDDWWVEAFNPMDF